MFIYVCLSVWFIARINRIFSYMYLLCLLIVILSDLLSILIYHQAGKISDNRLQSVNEPVSSIRYKLTCVYSEDLNLSVHPHSLTRVLGFLMNKRWTPGYIEDSGQIAHMQGRIQDFRKGNSYV